MEFFYTIGGFILAGIGAFTLCSFALSPVTDWFEVKIYYPKKYQKKYNKGNAIRVFIFTPLFFGALCTLFTMKGSDISTVLGSILGCIISVIMCIIEILTPKGYMGIIKDEKDKEEYLELDKKISQTNDIRERDKYKERQKEIFDKYLK